MAWDANWRERVAWSKRSPEFGVLTVGGEKPLMEYLAPLDDSTWRYWESLPAHPSILTLRTPRRLEYAALDWNAQPATRALAGLELARVYEWLLKVLDSEVVPRFTAPRVFYDLEGEVRIAFVRPDRPRQPRRKLFSHGYANHDQRVLVRVIGKCLDAMVAPPTESAEVSLLVERAVKRRFRSLAAMRKAFEAVETATIPHEVLETWTTIEMGIGFLELDLPTRAASCFAKVLDRRPTYRPALDGRAAAHQRVAERGELELPPPQSPLVDPSFAAPNGIVAGEVNRKREPAKPDELDPEWLRRAAWDKRSPGFGELSADLTKVRMSFGPPGDAQAVVPEALWTIWVGLPKHPNILEAIGPGALRYAALDWSRGPLSIEVDPSVPALLATWGVSLTRIYEFLLRHVPPEQLGWLTCPLVSFDLEGELRIGFVMGAAQSAVLPPEVIERWPSCDERGLVFAIGQALNALSGDALLGSASPIGDIGRRCVEVERAKRFENLDTLRDAFVAAGGIRKAPIGARNPRKRFDRLERALGQRLVDDQAGVLGQRASHAVPRGSWPIAQDPPPPSLPARYLGGNAAPVSTEPPTSTVSTEPLTPARAAYVEGKAALVHGKLAAARDAFDRAIALQPQMLEAMLLRGEVERMTNRLRREVGTGDAKALPAHLATLEPLLVGDRFEEGIAKLRSFEDDPAQQLLADVLVQHGRADEALAIYDRLTSSEALAGRAAALQQLGRSGEAEVALDQYVALAVSRSELRTRGAQR